MMKIQSSLSKLELEHMLVFAKSNHEALSMLCDNTHYEGSPEIVLVNADNPKSSIELLKVIRSYYSLRYLKIFLLVSDADQLKSFDFSELEITGYLKKPLDFDNFPDKRALMNNNLFLNALMK